MSDDLETVISHISYDCPHCGWAQSSEIGAPGEIEVECGGCSEKLENRAAVTVS